jgi:glycerophosphoryl diester phosphodiesterase
MPTAQAGGALDLPAVIAHRGASAYAPENTLAAFRKAAALGARWIELDVHLARDGTPVILHDDRVDRTSDGKGDAAAMTFEELKRLDMGSWFSPAFAGERLPSLIETIELCAELGLGANVEIKPTPGAEIETGHAVGAMLTESWPARLPAPLVSSFKPASLAACRETAPDIARGLLRTRAGADWRAQLELLGCRTLHLDHRHLAASLVRAARAAGYPVLAYTINDPVRAKTLFDWGVTTIISDCPERIAEIAKGSPSAASRPT